MNGLRGFRLEILGRACFLLQRGHAMRTRTADLVDESLERRGIRTQLTPEVLLVRFRMVYRFHAKGHEHGQERGCLVAVSEGSHIEFPLTIEPEPVVRRHDEVLREFPFAWVQVARIQVGREESSLGKGPLEGPKYQELVEDVRSYDADCGDLAASSALQVLMAGLYLFGHPAEVIQLGLAFELFRPAGGFPLAGCLFLLR